MNVLISDQDIEAETPREATELHTTTPPFPLGSLPVPIRQLVKEGSEALPVPPDLLALPALVTASAAIGNSRILQVKNEWTESPCLYAAIVSAPGAMKSPALDIASKPLKELQQDGTRTWTSDATMESVVRLLEKNPRGLLVSRDELSGWIKGMNQYKGGKGADKEFYLSVWGGQAHVYDRASDGGTSIILGHPFLSIVGAIPPDVLHALDISGGEADGFLPRILFAWPDAIPVRWSDIQVTEETLSTYRGMIETLYALSYDPTVGPQILEFTPEAQQDFKAWHDLHMEEMEHQTLSPFLQGVYAKLKGYCVRLSLIHALGVNPETESVGLEALEAGIALVDYFKGQGHKVDALFDHQQADPVERAKAAIRRQLSVSVSMSRRDLQRKMNCSAEIFQQALDEMSKAEVLIQEGQIQWNW